MHLFVERALMESDFRSIDDLYPVEIKIGIPAKEQAVTNTQRADISFQVKLHLHLY